MFFATFYWHQSKGIPDVSRGRKASGLERRRVTDSGVAGRDNAQNCATRRHPRDRAAKRFGMQIS